MTVYNKLVRDKIPQILKEENKRFTVRRASQEEMLSFLKRKLLEEVQEFLEEPCLEEMCDVQEVMDGLLREMKYTMGELRLKRADKINKKGAFTEGWILEEVEDD